MRFFYQYRTSDNVLHDGEISAGDREAAFAALKERGIRPSRLQEAPGFANKLFGKGKRWAVIVLLAIVAAGSLFVARSTRKAAADAKKETDKILQSIEEKGSYETRGQIYGDPVMLEAAFSSGWSDFLSDESDRFLAAFAVPGRPAGVSSARGLPVDLSAAIERNIVIAPDDLPEVAKMKRIVNGMKKEARAYLAAGGNISGYARRLERRQQEESMIFARVQKELSETNDPGLVAERNKSLRAMGLPMVDLSQNGE